MEQAAGLYEVTPVAREENPLWQATELLYESGYASPSPLYNILF
jgi:hypothetical protein